MVCDAVKILHVTHGYYPEDTGGVEAYLRMIVEAQRTAGDDVGLLVGSTVLRAQCELERQDADGVRVHRLFRDDWYNDHYAFSHHSDASRLIRGFFAEEHPDVVHVHQWVRLSSDLVALAHELGLPTVVTLHDVYTSCPRAFRVDRDEKPCTRDLSIDSCAGCVPRFGHESEREIALGIELFRDQYRSELQLADRVLVAAQVTADLLGRTLDLPRGRFTVQALPYRSRFSEHRGGDGNRATGAGNRGADAGARPFRFGYWGSLSPHKGPHVLLDAFRTLVSRVDAPLELHLFGPLATDDVRARLESCAAGLPVTMHGPFDAAQLEQAGLDAAVFPVLCFEGFGLGLAEAFELGLPAIVSDIGALAERVGDAGLLVPPDDVDALADAMQRLATDAKLRAGLLRAIPDPPEGPQKHIAELRDHYTAVSAADRRDGPRVAAERRTTLALLQRESLAATLRDLRGRRDPR